ncbi:MAG: flagellar basal body-associated FliL family protein [Rubrivivax sp.]|nr:flagellar basal body-associated FliL family protein [Rubrivivax sp.]
MSAAAAAVDAPPPKDKKKKLILIIAIAAVLLASAGGTAVVLMKKKANAEAEAEEAGEEVAPKSAAATGKSKVDPKAVPVFVPLEPFTVNLADRDAERYAQIGITLEIDDAKTGDQIKAYLPAIRNNILMAIADRTAADLMGRDGKARLAARVRYETVRAMGYEVAEPASDGEAGEGAPKADAPPKKKRSKPEVALPVKAVHFSNFIIQ